MKITVAHSPDSDDAFMFYGLASGAVDAEGIEVEQVLSDIETFWGSPIYWTKMGLVVALLVNGFVMTRAETTLVHDDSTTAAGWRTLHRTAIASLGLWFLITALGIALVNFS